MSKRACLAMVATVTVLGCGVTIQSTPLSGPYPPRSADDEILVWSVGLPECPFEEVSLVTVRDGLGAPESAVLLAMKGEARRVGGDGIVGLRFIPSTEAQGDSGLSATVIRFSGAECRR